MNCQKENHILVKLGDFGLARQDIPLKTPTDQYKEFSIPDQITPHGECKIPS